MSTVRLTAAQAVVRFLQAQVTETGEGLFAGVWAIFGHGNVAGLGEALYGARGTLPTLRAHNEQGMALAAAAFAKATRRRRMMACTSSIGPGATNMLTAAALAHVNRLPVLFLPGDVFASRRPDPVLQQTEDWGDATASVNDCFRPVSRWFDRITRPEQLIASLPNAMRVLTDPAECGPATLSLCQDVQADAFDFPAGLFEPTTHHVRRPGADPQELGRAAEMLRRAERPLIVAGGGLLYSEAEAVLAGFAERHGIPVAETQAGKGALAWDHPMAVGGIGVTGTSAANALAREADLIVAIGTRLQDFTTGSRLLLKGGTNMVHLNVLRFDASKHGAVPVTGDARRSLEELAGMLDPAPRPEWRARLAALKAEWDAVVAAATAPHGGNVLPSDAQVIGAVNRNAGPEDVVVCAAGGLPGELHKLWRAAGPGTYHLEYGYSCMGYEIAGGLGVRLARPDGEVFVMVGDGSYLMLNSELQTSVLLGRKLIVTVLDNGGFGCIDRLQRACGGEAFNNLVAEPGGLVDFAGHARSLGCLAERVDSIAQLQAALVRARQASRISVIVIPTDPRATTEAGGAWWDVAVPEVSDRGDVCQARAAYEEARR